MIEKTSNHRFIYAKIIASALIFGVIMSIYPTKDIDQVRAQETLWKIQSIDTMKVSRDRAREGSLKSMIPAIVDSAIALNPTHVAVGTPYDSEFVPVIRHWAQAIHSRNKNVWFRGNFSGWEGWFEYDLLESPEKHHQLTFELIVNNKDLFKDGDIFTPIPEPENGLMGDPRTKNKQQYIDFLIRSYDTCVSAFKKIDVDVTCGYFGTNGDIAKEILTAEVVQQIGGVVVVDHYVRDPQTYVDDINFLSERLQAPIIIGEFGAPIPDIHGKVSQDEQVAILDSYMKVFHQMNDQVIGLNYWVLQEGSTALAEDDLDPKQAYFLIQDYYTPLTFSGQIMNSLDQPIEDANVVIDEYKNSGVTSNANGQFSLLFPKNEVRYTVNAKGYDPLDITTSNQDNQIILIKSNPSFWYRLQERFKKFVVTLNL